MKNRIIILFILLMFLCGCAANEDYQSGFKDGYKEGYSAGYDEAMSYVYNHPDADLLSELSEKEIFDFLQENYTDSEILEILYNRSKN